MSLRDFKIPNFKFPKLKMKDIENIEEVNVEIDPKKINERNKNEFYKDLEIELLEKVNELGIGPQGFGGRTTAIGLNIETYPTHIAGLPVAVNINCHATRHKEVIL